MASSKQGSRKPVTFRQVNSEDIWCKYCRKLYEEPMLLPCLHTFCKRCVGSILSESDNSLFCPICRSELPMSSRNIDGFLPNIIVIRKLEEFERQKLGQCEEDCSGCENTRNMASYRCMECQESLCGDCRLAHRRVKLTREHEILSLEEFVDRTNPRDTSDRLSCLKHNSEDLNMYCKTCSLLACKECRTAVDHPADHEIVPLQAAVDSTKPIMVSLLSATRQNIPSLQKDVYETIKVYGRWHNRIDDVSWQIRRTTRRLIQVIKDKERELLKKLNAIRDKGSAVLATRREEIERNLVCTIDGCDFTEEVLKQGKNTDMLMVKNLICQRLCELQGYKVDSVVFPRNVIFESNEKPIVEAISNAYGTIREENERSAQASLTSLPNGGDSSIPLSVPVDDDESSASALSSDGKKTGTTSESSSAPSLLEDINPSKKSKGRRFGFPALTLGKKSCLPVGEMTPTKFVIPTTDSRGRPREVTVQLESPDGSVISAKILDNKNGTYTVFYCPRTPGEHNLFISLFSKHIKNGRRILNFYGSFSGLKGEELTLVSRSLCLIKWHVTPGLVQIEANKKAAKPNMNLQDFGQSVA